MTKFSFGAMGKTSNSRGVTEIFLHPIHKLSVSQNDDLFWKITQISAQK